MLWVGSIIFHYSVVRPVYITGILSDIFNISRLFFILKNLSIWFETLGICIVLQYGLIWLLNKSDLIWSHFIEHAWMETCAWPFKKKMFGPLNIPFSEHFSHQAVNSAQLSSYCLRRVVPWGQVIYFNPPGANTRILNYRIVFVFLKFIGVNWGIKLIIQCYSFYQRYSFTNHIFNIYMYEQDLVLNNPEGLICYKINKPTNIYIYAHRDAHELDGISYHFLG